MGKEGYYQHHGIQLSEPKLAKIPLGLDWGGRRNQEGSQGRGQGLYISVSWETVCVPWKGPEFTVKDPSQSLGFGTVSKSVYLATMRHDDDHNLPGLL